MITLRIFAAMIFGLLVEQDARAEPDVLLQAVSFALTGSDANKVVAVDRTKCIFKLKDDTYYFNNIYTDRISFQNMRNGMGDRWISVDIHGKKEVVKHYSAPPTFTGSELDYQWKATVPGYFDPAGHTSISTDEAIRVDTHESERLVRAWQYIFSNGCKGVTSPF